MFRFVGAFSLLSLLLCSVGCRICAPPCDFPVSAYIERYDDYRGFNPLYRAGSLLSDGETLHGVCYEGDFVDYYSNAGNYGVTTPVTTLRHTPGMSVFETGPNTELTPIAVPPQRTTDGGLLAPPRRSESNRNGGTVPSIEDLLNRERGMMQLPTPMSPPSGLRPSFEMPSDAIPFAPSDAIPNSTVPMPNRTVPSGTMPNSIPITPPRNTYPRFMETDPPITLEELQRLDPTIQDVQIISIEDTPPGSFIR